MQSSAQVARDFRRASSTLQFIIGVQIIWISDRMSAMSRELISHLYVDTLRLSPNRLNHKEPSVSSEKSGVQRKGLSFMSRFIEINTGPTSNSVNDNYHTCMSLQNRRSAQRNLAHELSRGMRHGGIYGVIDSPKNLQKMS